MLKEFFSTIFLSLSFLAYSQDLKDEVQELNTRYPDYRSKDSTIVFTGSSSIRMWHQLQKEFPAKKIVNTGFGGSETSNLIYYHNELIVRFQPKKVFIYEGDNDIARGKSAKKAFRHMKRLLRKLRRKLPDTQFVLISAKPSIARWHLKDEYAIFNASLKKLADRKEAIAYLNVWDPMLDDGLEPIKNIFIEDGLHMNAKGYQIWKAIIEGYL